MNYKKALLLSLIILMLGLTVVSATDSDDSSTTIDDSGSDVSSSTTTSQATDTTTHTDTSVAQSSDTSTSSSSSQKTSDTTSHVTTQKTSEKTQTTSDTTTKTSSDTNTQTTSQSTQQATSDTNTTKTSSNTVNEKTVDTTKTISTADDITSEAGTVHSITPSNVGDLDDIIAECSPGDTLNFQGNFSDLEIIIYDNLTITSNNGANFTDTTIYLTSGSDGATVSNLFINNSNTAQTEVIMIETGVCYLNITNNTLIVNTTDTFGALNLNESHYSSVTNNNITISALANEITHDENNYPYEGTVETYAIGVFNSSFVNVTDNIINISNSVRSSDADATLVGIVVQGSTYYYNNVHDIIISGNKITMKNDKYTYGITLHYNIDKCNVTNNTITEDNTSYYACGIELYVTNNSTIVSDNTINLSVTNLTYGINVMGSGYQLLEGTKISNNNINVTAANSKGIELYFTSDSTITGNEIITYGNYAEGIAIGSTVNAIVNNNNIRDNGVRSTENINIPFENIPFISVGIYVVKGSWYVNKDLNITQDSEYNNITENNIYCQGQYAVNLTGNYNNIKNNYATSNIYNGPVLTGDSSILVSGTGNNCSDNKASSLSSSNEEELAESNVIIVTQDNYEDYFINDGSDDSPGLSYLVNDGDVLDIQGNISFDYRLVIDKAVNITSTTNDGMFIGKGADNIENRLRLTITESGSNTNITNVTFFDMALFTVTAHNITMDHINVTSKNIYGLGSTTGIVSIRESSSNINITNSFFQTEENGGASTVVLAGATYVDFINNTIIGIGDVGNLFYLTTYDTTDGNNGYANIINNTIIGPDTPSDICIAFAIAGSNLYVANNFINYTGSGITGQSGGDAYQNNNIFINNTVNGTGIQVINSTVINCTGDYIEALDSIAINNTARYSMNVTGDNMTIENNTLLYGDSFIINSTNTLINNNTFNGTNLLIQVAGSNNTITNNKINATNTTMDITGSGNIIENNTMHSISDVAGVMSFIEMIRINSDSNDNIIQNNDLYQYDFLRDSYATGDDCVYVAENTTGNIVQNNYGDVTNVTLPTDDTNYTYITQDVTSMEELITALEDIKTNGVYSEDTKYVINLQEGTYTVTEAINWANATSDVRELIINGNGQTINGNQFTSTFLTIDAGYTLSLNNITFTNFTLSDSIYTISNDGNLTITNSTFDNAGIIYTVNSQYNRRVHTPESYTVINSTNFTQTVIRSNYATVTMIINSSFYDTDLSSSSIALINNTGGNLTFFNNTVTNITADYCIYSDRILSNYGLNPTTFIEENTFTDLNCSVNTIYYNLQHNSLLVDGAMYSLMNNIFNTTVNISYTILGTGEYNFTSYILNNTYINNSIPINMSTIDDGNVTDEDFTTSVTLEALNDTYGAAVDGQVEVLINGNEYKTFDVVNGVANITIENNALNFADNNITVKYVPDGDNYVYDDDDVTFTVTENIKLSVNEENITVGENITITVQVAVRGEMATEGYVIFKINGKTIKGEDGNDLQVNITNGVASLQYALPNTLSSTYTISAIYHGQGQILKASDIEVTATSSGVTIDIDPITTNAGKTITLTAHLTDEFGNPITSGKLIFKLNGKTLKDADGNTLYATIDANGVATLTYTIPDDYSAKDYIITAVFQGAGYERTENNSTLTLERITPTIEIDSNLFTENNTITITQGQESLQLTGQIIDPTTNDTVIKDTTVTVKLNQKTVTQVNVTNGVIDITLDTSTLKYPTYNLTIVSGDNRLYYRTTFNGTLVVVATDNLINETSYNGTLLAIKED